jgi:hypothetical protein
MLLVNPAQILIQPTENSPATNSKPPHSAENRGWMYRVGGRKLPADSAHLVSAPLAPVGVEFIALDSH